MTTSASTPTANLEDRAHSPGKLILSGEHSVLYGQPALAMAIAQYTEVWFKPLDLGDGIKTAFDNLSGGQIYPLKLLSRFKSSLDHRFDQFKRGELAVHKILTRPDDLAVYTLASILQERPTGTSPMPGFGALHQFPFPGQLGSRSMLPIGAGMGSSAAVVAAITVLIETLLDRPKTLEERSDRVRFCERLKHGKAGPIDAATVVQGGLVYVGADGMGEAKISEGHGLLTGDGWYSVLHGRPDSSTGECVSLVRERHGSDSALWDGFGACTRDLANALRDGADPSDVIKENQRLLERIGVVPGATKAFVRDVEAVGGVAKICGAGSVRGNHGGAVLVHLTDPEAMTALMAQHPNLSSNNLRLAPKGAAAGPAPHGFEAAV